MARVLNCEYDLATEEMAHISHPAKDLVSKLLIFDLDERLCFETRALNCNTLERILRQNGIHLC